MGAFEVRKASDNSNNGFDETIEYKVLHCGNVSGNNNKHYTIEIQKDNKGQHRIFTHYGRLGISNIYEIREKIEGKPVFDYDTVKKEYDSIIKKKLKGKTIKEEDGSTYTERYVEIDVAIPNTGSVNIQGKGEKKVQATVKKAIDTSSYHPEVSRIVDQFVKENIHHISSVTTLKFTANGFMSPIGAITKEHCQKAKLPLNELNKKMDRNGIIDINDKEVKELNTMYFSMIPHPFGRKITEEDMISGAKKLDQEFDLLDQIETAVSMGQAMAGSANQQVNALGSDIDLLTDRVEIERLKHFIVSSKAANHRHDEVWKYRPVSFYKIRIPEERQRYETKGKQKGNIKECFHGSSSSNCCSILKSGLVIPPCNASHVCGRMMGSGAYYGLSSTKSARYSLGSWGGKRSSYGNIFLFVADLALGKYYETYTAVPNGTPRGYDSIWAKAGQSLYNDELVTPYLENQTLKYLVELKP